MMTRRLFSIFAVAAMAVTPLLLQAGGEQETRRRAGLTGARSGNMTPSGHADFRAREGRARLNVEVEDVNLPVGTVLDVYLNDSKIGTITVQPVIQGGELELNSQDGAMVPSVSSGSLVVVKSGGAAIVAGVF